MNIEDEKTRSFNETGLFRRVSRLPLSMIVDKDLHCKTQFSDSVPGTSSLFHRALERDWCMIGFLNESLHYT